MRIHADERDIDDALVRRLVDDEFPEWRPLPLTRVGDGTVNAIYRLGDELSVRLPRRDARDNGTEERILQTLSGRLPVEIPRFVARGEGFVVHTWLEGELPDAPLAAGEVATLVHALRRVAAPGPEPVGGRGRPLADRDAGVRDALERVDAPGACELWEEAMHAPEWGGDRVWIHCDLDPRNVLVRDGGLAAVLDWGGAGVGDPAVDVMAAWKLVAREQRDRFRELLEVDDATWLRAKGWLVSQALIALGYYTLDTYPPLVHEARRWLAEVLDR